MELKKLVFIGSALPEELKRFNPVVFANLQTAKSLALPEMAFVVDESLWEKAQEELKEVVMVKMGKNWLQALKEKDVLVWRTKVVAVTGSTGSGKTLLSCLMALGAKSLGLKPLIVDFNVAYGGGDISFYFQLPKSPNWNTFLSGASLTNSVIGTEVGDILQLPPKPIEITQEKVEELIRQAKSSYDLIVLDLPEKYLKFVNCADEEVFSDGKLPRFNFPFLQKAGGWRELSRRKEAVEAGQKLLKHLGVKE
ncbi:tyrosine-protein kinase family protein [Carboxydothermus ferrireducens]|uniref:ABC-type dipeptide/oligopeptide/nickel transport system ATPase component n=1 Tax=Carboxydothermus ferrireducens DSM 11255 TaxID=1119529 RepID=A0ABX2RAJ9_9THEO|nr:hypothetical protein [Carboxydothermus ferrireducens]NYE57161.1 ABC-type dipeptide/oligopeptide/nickel transport system ATPase component [Carboxydothermus ferrireducens DSM 11255]